jgi:hypothetical protein
VSRCNARPLPASVARACSRADGLSRILQSRSRAAQCVHSCLYTGTEHWHWQPHHTGTALLLHSESTGSRGPAGGVTSLARPSPQLEPPAARAASETLPRRPGAKLPSIGAPRRPVRNRVGVTVPAFPPPGAAGGAPSAGASPTPNLRRGAAASGRSRAAE